ncbi:MAG: sugar phosphate isomerase/epimerase [Candidatus Scalindua rubra]|uniref:Xylose isomerase-like TIM barrel n=1 Tax=Candidatus Scalindua brodae TaxID=237368 RepID=A0A0B0EMR8_9BACT|nr:MAG: Xylose isomerase-like TIM barrel [Candidatus Scalindua brodae]MBZ0110312.1 sugar phosphate isomerase/epimerase [Candidatus Scalindua rubra]
MLGISTVWKSGEFKDGQKLMESLASLGFSEIELEYRISQDTFKGIKEFLKKTKDVKIASIHNFFPIPDIHETGGADIYHFSAEDAKERSLAVRYAIKTIQIAADLGARAVVLHLGRVHMDTLSQELFSLFDAGLSGSGEYKSKRDEIRILRDRKKGKTLEMMLLSMDEIQKAAEKYDVSIGIENRYFFEECPSFDEMGVIFEKFGGGRIGYWHDAGHAQVQENLGFVPVKDLLSVCGKFIVGFHLHDVNGYSDHHVPGTGEVDFKLLKKYIKEDTIKILEIHPRETEKDLMDGVAFLNNMDF